MSTTWAPCSNGGTRHRSRGGNLVGAGKRHPAPDFDIQARADCLTLEAEDQGLTLDAKDISTDNGGGTIDA